MSHRLARRPHTAPCALTSAARKDFANTRVSIVKMGPMTSLRPVLAIFAAALAASPLRAEIGVTDAELVLGQPAAFTGPSAGLGIEMWRGAETAFAEANARGGVHGRKIRLAVADDGYDAEK